VDWVSVCARVCHILYIIPTLRTSDGFLEGTLPTEESKSLSEILGLLIKQFLFYSLNARIAVS
jgi:hypothetical protein